MLAALDLDIETARADARAAQDKVTMLVATRKRLEETIVRRKRTVPKEQPALPGTQAA